MSRMIGTVSRGGADPSSQEGKKERLRMEMFRLR